TRYELSRTNEGLGSGSLSVAICGQYCLRRAFPLGIFAPTQDSISDSNDRQRLLCLRQCLFWFRESIWSYTGPFITSADHASPVSLLYGSRCYWLHVLARRIGKFSSPRCV